MAYRGGGRGSRHGDRPSFFVWPPPPSTPRSVPIVGTGYLGPMVLPRHRGAHGVLAAVYRWAPTPASPQVSLSPAPAAAVPVTTRAAPPSSASDQSAPASSALSPAALLAKDEEAFIPVPVTAQGTTAADDADEASYVFDVDLAPRSRKGLARLVDVDLAPRSRKGLERLVHVNLSPLSRKGLERLVHVDLAPLSRKGLARTARSGLATVAKMVLIRAEDFLLNVADNDLFHYEVAISSESNSRVTNREVLNGIIKLHGKTVLGGKLTAYDGRDSLYTAGSLPFESKEFVVMLVDSEKEEKERAEKEYKITIRFTGRTDLHQLQEFLCARQRDVAPEIIHAPDIVIKKSPYWNHVTLCTSFFSTTSVNEGDIGEGLEHWKGYYQSICPKLMGVSPRIEAFATNILKPLSVVMKFAEEFLSLCDTSQHLSGRHHVRVGIYPKSNLSEKKKSREAKKKLFAELMKLFLEISPDEKLLTRMKDRESFISFGMRKVLKDIASRLAWRFKKFAGKMITCHLSDVIEKVHGRLARKLLKVNCKENVTAGRPPIISRPNKELVVQCPQTRDLMVGIDQCWRYPSPQPEVIITRPIAVKYYRPLDQVLGDIQMKFDYVTLPHNLRKPSMRRNFVSFLNSLSQNLIHQLLVTVCREGHEVRNVCWHGAFELSDIWLSEGHLKVNPYLAYSEYTEEGGRKDYKKLHELIFKAFRDPVTQAHPCLVDSLLGLLDRAPEVKRRDHDFITYLINHPCLLSYAERLKIFFVLEKMIEKLKPPFSHLLEQVLSNNSGWGNVIQDIEELKDAYFHDAGTDAAGNQISVYGKGLDQAFRFARNFLNHTRATVKSLKEAEAALCFVLPLLLHSVLLLLMLTFVGPGTWDLMAVISMKNADRTEVQFGWDWVELPASTNLYKKPRVD